METTQAAEVTNGEGVCTWVPMDLLAKITEKRGIMATGQTREVVVPESWATLDTTEPAFIGTFHAEVNRQIQQEGK